MKRNAGLMAFCGLLLAAWAVAAAAAPLKIGVVDLQRLVKESPQAQRAKANMARKFSDRKATLEKQSDSLQADIDRLKRDGGVMSDDERDKLQSNIRDRQRTLQMEQGQYNDDVADAEQNEYDRMRGEIRDVIDQYAKKNGYDLILGDSALYASSAVDVTDQILAQLKKQKGS